MNFIIEILPKKENGNQFVYVVRNGQGYPLITCESLEGAKDFIQEKFDEMRAAMAKQSNSNA